MLETLRSLDAVPKLQVSPRVARSRVLFTYIEEMQLLSSAPDASSEQEDVALEPCDLCGWILIAYTGIRHDCRFVRGLLIDN